MLSPGSPPATPPPPLLCRVIGCDSRSRRRGRSAAPLTTQRFDRKHYRHRNICARPSALLRMLGGGFLLVDFLCLLQIYTVPPAFGGFLPFLGWLSPIYIITRVALNVLIAHKKDQRLRRKLCLQSVLFPTAVNSHCLPALVPFPCTHARTHAGAVRGQSSLFMHGSLCLCKSTT